MADWSLLPSDVLCEIALKLDEIEDFIYFSVVCHSWNRASSLIKHHLNAKRPWLLLAENTNENPDCRRKLYNLNNHKCYQLKLPKTFGTKCWGSCYGWLVMQTCDFQLHLLNPLTNVEITSLPSLLTLPRLCRDPLKRSHWFFKYFVQKVVVLKMPVDGNGGGDDLLVAAFYGNDYLALARPGDLSWTNIDLDTHAHDIIRWDNHIYILDESKNLQYCDIKEICDYRDLKVLDYVPLPEIILWGLDRMYLLNLGDNLIVVIRKLDEVIEGEDEDEDGEDEGGEEEGEDVDFPAMHLRTSCFEIYSLTSKSKKWVKINNFGNFAIFVGMNSSFSVPVSMIDNLKGNSIYFSDDHGKFGDSGFGEVDMGVYNMDSGDITAFYEGDDIDSCYCPPVFFVPNI